MNRYAVRIGQAFEVDISSISDLGPLPALVEQANRYRSATRRDQLALSVLGAMAMVLIIAAGMGVNTGRYSELHSVWDALMVPLTAVLTFYFTGGNH